MLIHWVRNIGGNILEKNEWDYYPYFYKKWTIKEKMIEKEMKKEVSNMQ